MTEPEPTNAATAPQPRVVAVTLTYRRADLLPVVVEAVLGQSRPPDAYLVIDNGGEAGTTLGDRDGVRIVETGSNLGVSGGYRVALEEALAEGAERIWAIDDDVIPDPACLERLLESDAGIVIPRQRRAEGSGFWLLWNGGLLDASLVRKVGAPGDYFYWVEDVDYLARVREAKGRVERVPDELVTHRAAARRSRGETRDWRLYYVVRNTLHFRFRVRRAGFVERLRTWWGITKTAGAIVLFEPKKRRSLGLIRRGVRDYRRGVLGKTIDPETWTSAG
jgi:GT2 family glycosyltransferase